MADDNSSVQPGTALPSLLQPGEIIPVFTLPGADGMPFSPWTYKQRENLVLLFTRSTTSSETRGILRSFAQEYTTFREEICTILAITPETVIANLRIQEELHLPFPLLADPKGEVSRRYTSRDDTTGLLNPSFVLADRYGTLYQQWTVQREVDFPPIEELLESLRYINRLCTP